MKKRIIVLLAAVVLLAGCKGEEKQHQEVSIDQTLEVTTATQGGSQVMTEGEVDAVPEVSVGKVQDSMKEEDEGLGKGLRWPFKSVGLISWFR